MIRSEDITVTSFRVHIKDRKGHVYSLCMPYNRLVDCLTLVHSAKGIIGSIPNALLTEAMINCNAMDSRIEVTDIQVV